MSAAAHDELLFEVREGIGQITFNRPQARNALTFAMYEEVAAIVDRIADTTEIKALVLTGAGGQAFAAGTDITQFRDFRTAQDALDYEARMDRILGTLERAQVPTIAAIAGACTGGGAAIAAACDLRIAAPGIRFGFPVARTLGNILSMTNFVRLVSLIGIGRTRDLILTARLLDAQEAFSAGLVLEVVADEAALLPRAQELAQNLASHAPLTMRATKEALLRIRERLLPEASDDLLLSCYLSADFREGMDAFLNKRKPEWTGS